MQTILLKAHHISKSFRSNRVLTEASLAIAPGEVVSLIGENGAGKSTFAKILAGILKPDSGELYVRGQAVSFSSPGEALAAGIGIVHQELCLADNLTVAENIFLGREPTKRGLLDREGMVLGARAALSRLNSTIDPACRVATLSTAEKQMVEIARALSYNAQLLIFDEPTSSLSDTDAATLLELIKKLRAQGISVLYVSHRLAEVLELSDRVVALRDGCNTGEVQRSEANRNTLISLIVGRELKDVYGVRTHKLGPVALEVNNLRATPSHSASSLVVRSGEIVAISGLMGSGRTELIESIFGARTPISGTVCVRGELASIASPTDALALGIALVPEERKVSGLLLDSSIIENIILSITGRLARSFLRDTAAERKIANALASLVKVRCAHLDQPVKELSGGNQQKVVLAKCLATEPSVLLLDEPTRGIDVGARREIYAELRRLASEGLAILFVSSDLEEVLGLADRVLVMSDGALQGELQRYELSEQAIMALASPEPAAKIAA